MTDAPCDKLSAVRAIVAALVGGVAGAAVAAIVLANRPDSPPEPPRADEGVAGALARIEERVDRLEKRNEVRTPRTGERPVAASAPMPVAEVVPRSNGRHPRDTPAPPDADLSKVPSADLALEADERHARDFDISGAARRYRELLARGGSAAERRHWYIGLGDCYVRLNRIDEGMAEYRNCVDASTEDHAERVGCMIALARNARSTNPADARRWIDRALELGEGRSCRAVHETAVFLARDSNQTDVEIRELTWLIERFPDEADAGAGWKERVAQLRGEKR